MNETESDIDMYRADMIALQDRFRRLSRQADRANYDYVRKHRQSLFTSPSLARVRRYCEENLSG